MAASIKMDETTKSRLEELQARIKLETGKRVTQQELLDRIVEHAIAMEDEVIDSFRDEWQGLTPEEIEDVLSGTISSGAPLDEGEMDDLIYGSEIP